MRDLSLMRFSCFFVSKRTTNNAVTSVQALSLQIELAKTHSLYIYIYSLKQVSTKEKQFFLFDYNI